MSKPNRRELLKLGAATTVAAGLSVPSAAQTDAADPATPKAVVTAVVAQYGSKPGTFQVGLAIVVSDEQGQRSFAYGQDISSFNDYARQIKDITVKVLKGQGFTVEPQDILVFGGPMRHDR